jgi:hypothetical protein
MSVYSAGVGEDIGSVPFLPDGALSESPGALKADIDTLDLVIERLWEDVQRSKLSTAQKNNVKSFVLEWKHFLKRNATFIDRSVFAKSTVRRYQDFRSRAEALRQKLEKMKVTTTPPAPYVEHPVKEGVNWKRVLLVGGIVTVGVGAGVFIYRRVKRARELREGEQVSQLPAVPGGMTPHYHGHVPVKVHVG